MIQENKFWRVCEALDCLQRVKLQEHLLSIEKSGFPCVCGLAVFRRAGCQEIGRDITDEVDKRFAASNVRKEYRFARHWFTKDILHRLLGQMPVSTPSFRLEKLIGS